jgi:branched-chain amino acid transport system ATP-binding protein
VGVSNINPLATGPKIIIADEMSLGLAPLVFDAVFEGVEQARRAGVPVLPIEQFIHRALGMANECAILLHGRVEWTGAAGAAGAEVIDRYLGEAAE